MLEAGLIYLRRQLVARPTTDVQKRMRADLYHHLQHLPVAFHDRWRSGQLLSRAISDLKLVSFARALLADPAVLVLDEATSSLDIPSERAVQAALATVLAGRTALIIAHRLSTVLVADRVLVLSDGEVIEDGPQPN